MTDFINSLESIQDSIYWNGVLVSLLEISFFLSVFFTILFYVIKSRISSEDGKAFIQRLLFVGIGVFTFLLFFSVLLMFNLKKETKKSEVQQTNYSYAGITDFRFVENLDGTFIKADYKNGKIISENLVDGFNCKVNKYGEYYLVPIDYKDKREVSFTADYDLSIERAFIDDIDTSDAKIYITIVNNGNIDIERASIQIKYERDNFSELKDTLQLNNIKALSSKVFSFSFDSTKINKVNDAELNIYVVLSKDPDTSNNKMRVSYFK